MIHGDVTGVERVTGVDRHGTPSDVLGHPVADGRGLFVSPVRPASSRPPPTDRVTADRSAGRSTALPLPRPLADTRPSAGATTRIVSPGILTSASEPLTTALAALLVTTLGPAPDRLLGVRRPVGE